MTTEKPILSGVHIFEGLDSASIERISADCHWREVAAGSMVLSRGEISDDITFVQRGSLKATVYTSSGKEVALRELRPGDVFGDYAAIDEQPRSAHVIAIENSLIASLPGADFLDILVRHPIVAIEEMRSLTHMVRTMTDRVVELSMLQANYRIQLELARLGDKYGHGQSTVTISPPPTYADIAARSSTRQDVVASEMDRLEDLGLICRQGRALVLENVGVLKMMAQHAVAGITQARS